MKTVYLDSNVYSVLLEGNAEHLERLVVLKKSKRVRFRCSVLNLEEFGHAAKNDSEKSRKLHELARKVCTSQLLKSPQDMITDDLTCFVRNGREAKRAYYTGDKAREHIQSWDWCISGEVLKTVPATIFEKTRDLKKSYRGTFRAAKRKLKPMWEPYSGIPFEEYWKETSKNPAFWDRMAPFFMETLGPKAGKQALENLDLSKLHRIRFFLKYDVAKTYQIFLKGEKPKWGDNVDWMHAFYVPCCDIFVTKDSNFLQTLRLIGEKRPKFMDCAEFIESFCQVS